MAQEAMAQGQPARLAADGMEQIKEAVMLYEQNKAQLQGWLDEFCPYGKEPGRFFRFTDHEDGRGKVIFCTAPHTYSLSFSEGYLGAVASARTVLPGEDWTRGNDLPDGKFSRETFDGIMRAVIAYELVDLAPVIEQVADIAVVAGVAGGTPE